MVILVDSSWSMSGAFAQVKTVILPSIITRCPEVMKSIIQFSSAVQTICPFVKDEPLLLESVEKMSLLGGSTNMRDAFKATTLAFERAVTDSSSPVVFFITVGQPDRAPTVEVKELLSLIPRPTIIGIGVGPGTNLTSLINILPGQQVFHFTDFAQLGSILDRLITVAKPPIPNFHLEFSPAANKLQRCSENLVLNYKLSPNTYLQDQIPAGAVLRFVPNKFYCGARAVTKTVATEDNPACGQIILRPIGNARLGIIGLPDILLWDIKIGADMFSGGISSLLAWFSEDFVLSKPINVLMWGFMGSGKSSFINGLASALSGDQRVLRTITTARLQTHVTRNYLSHPLGSVFVPPLKPVEKLIYNNIKVRFWDPWGLSDDNYTQVKLRHFLEGYIAHEAPMNDSRITASAKPLPGNAIHAVIFIVPITTARTTALLKLLDEQVLQAIELGYQPIVICNMSNKLLSSDERQAGFKKIVEASRLPANRVFLFDNYEEETLRNMAVDLTYREILNLVILEARKNLASGVPPGAPWEMLQEEEEVHVKPPPSAPMKARQFTGGNVTLVGTVRGCVSVSSPLETLSSVRMLVYDEGLTDPHSGPFFTFEGATQASELRVPLSEKLRFANGMWELHTVEASNTPQRAPLPDFRGGDVIFKGTVQGCLPGLQPTTPLKDVRRALCEEGLCEEELSFLFGGISLSAEASTPVSDVVTPESGKFYIQTQAPTAGPKTLLDEKINEATQNGIDCAKINLLFGTVGGEQVQQRVADVVKMKCSAIEERPGAEFELEDLAGSLLTLKPELLSSVNAVIGKAKDRMRKNNENRERVLSLFNDRYAEGVQRELLKLKKEWDKSVYDKLILDLTGSFNQLCVDRASVSPSSFEFLWKASSLIQDLPSSEFTKLCQEFLSISLDMIKKIQKETEPIVTAEFNKVACLPGPKQSQLTGLGLVHFILPYCARQEGIFAGDPLREKASSMVRECTALMEAIKNQAKKLHNAFHSSLSCGNFLEVTTILPDIKRLELGHKCLQPLVAQLQLNHPAFPTFQESCDKVKEQLAKMSAECDYKLDVHTPATFAEVEVIWKSEAAVHHMFKEVPETTVEFEIKQKVTKFFNERHATALNLWDAEPRNYAAINELLVLFINGRSLCGTLNIGPPQQFMEKVLEGVRTAALPPVPDQSEVANMLRDVSTHSCFTIMCLDESGSMDRDPWISLKTAVEAFCTRRISQCTQACLPCEDRVWVIGYTDSAFHRIPSSLEAEPERLVSGLSSRLTHFDGGMTSFQAPLAAVKQVLDGPGTRNRPIADMMKVLLFTTYSKCDDGDAEMQKLYNAHPDLKVFVVGFGEGCDAERLKSLAVQGHGSYFAGLDSAALMRVFDTLATAISAPGCMFKIEGSDCYVGQSCPIPFHPFRLDVQPNASGGMTSPPEKMTHGETCFDGASLLPIDSTAAKARDMVMKIIFNWENTPQQALLQSKYMTECIILSLVPDHPNVIHPLGALVIPCMSAEFVESPCAWNLFFQGLHAICHIESHFIVHRDIKGDNILIDPETGKLTLIDFGESQHCPNMEVHQSAMSPPWGNTGTMPPELSLFLKRITRGTSGVFSYSKCDSFALALTFWNALLPQSHRNGTHQSEPSAVRLNVSFPAVKVDLVHPLISSQVGVNSQIADVVSESQSTQIKTRIKTKLKDVGAVSKNHTLKSNGVQFGNLGRPQ
ncbi:hypothetical protein Pelo_17473 [Pelomyxa schiedti]|nr:hypothetical protein Pelo_17473 [Pelomyxa schiedti]